jgi:hypothetical protein
MFHWFLKWDELSNAEARSILPGSLFIPHAMFLACPAGANSVNTRTRDPFPLFPLTNAASPHMLSSCCAFLASSVVGTNPSSSACTHYSLHTSLLSFTWDTPRPSIRPCHRARQAHYYHYYEYYATTNYHHYSYYYSYYYPTTLFLHYHLLLHHLLSCERVRPEKAESSRPSTFPYPVTTLFDPERLASHISPLQSCLCFLRPASCILPLPSCGVPPYFLFCCFRPCVLCYSPRHEVWRSDARGSQFFRLPSSSNPLVAILLRPYSFRIARHTPAFPGLLPFSFVGSITILCRPPHITSVFPFPVSYLYTIGLSPIHSFSSKSNHECNKHDILPASICYRLT